MVSLFQKSGDGAVEEDERRVSGAFNDGGVELMVGVGADMRLIILDGVRHGVERAPNSREIERAGVFASEPRRVTFKRDARFHDVFGATRLHRQQRAENPGKGLRLRQRDMHAVAMPKFDHVEHFQRLERFAQAAATHP